MVDPRRIIPLQELEDAARRAAARFKVPSRDEVDDLKRRLDDLAGRLDAVAEERNRKG